MDDTEFETVDAGASNGKPMAAGGIKKGVCIIMKNRPCKIVDFTTSKTGKHGSVKIHYVGIDVFTGKKLEECRPSASIVFQTDVVRTECQLLSINNDGFLELLNSDMSNKTDIQGGDMLDTLKERFENMKDHEDLLVTYIAALGTEKVIECRLVSNK